MKKTVSATPNRSKAGRKMRQSDRASKVLGQVIDYKNKINALFHRAGIESKL